MAAERPERASHRGAVRRGGNHNTCCSRMTVVSNSANEPKDANRSSGNPMLIVWNRWPRRVSNRDETAELIQTYHAPYPAKCGRNISWSTVTV